MKQQANIIDTEDYKLKLTKSWVSVTEVWHIQIQSQSIFDNRFEMFLTDLQLKALKDSL